MPELKPPSATMRTGGCVLAGGQGSRMNGADKGLLELDGMTLVERSLKKLAPQVDLLAVNANRNLERYADFGAVVIRDRLLGQLGPLAGMHAALAHWRDTVEQVLFVPCDAPDLACDLYARLEASVQSALHGDPQGAQGAPQGGLHGKRRTPSAARAAYARAAYARAAGTSHPTFCLLPVILEHPLHEFLVNGGRRVEAFLVAVGAIAVDFDDEVAHFANLNSQDDLTRYRRQHPPNEP